MSASVKWRIGLVALAILILVSVLYPILAPAPSAAAHTWCPFGKAPGSSTANVCDRTVSGMWVSIAVGVLSSLIACGVGLSLALVARRFGRVADQVISRSADLFFAVPDVLVLIGIHIAARQLEVTGGHTLSPFWMMVISLAVIGWAAPARMIRNRLRSLEAQEFVAAAYAIGQTRWRVLTRELLPFAREYLLAIFLLRVPATILAESTVSFLGLGMPDSQPSLGSFLGKNPQQMLGNPMVIVPGWILLVIIVIAFQWTGQGLYRARAGGRMSLLEVTDLGVEVAARGRRLKLVEGISFGVERGRVVGLVGESGSGKSVTALSVLGLFGGQDARFTGEVRFEGRDLLRLQDRELRAIRGGKIGMIFQDPGASLNPMYTIGAQIVEAIRLHHDVSRAEARRRAGAFLTQVGLADADARLSSYPHELSGGMRQRAMIAIALGGAPQLLIADEPTTALDVTVQAQVMTLLGDLRRQHSLGVLLITHDLGLVAEHCDEVVVLYAGRVVERGATAEVLRAPFHPYTAGLLGSTLYADRPVERLQEIPGVVPDLANLPSGCRFRERCPQAQPKCADEEPALLSIGARVHRCHFPLVAS